MNAIWAKLGQNSWPELFHPLRCHLLDVAHVAMVLWEENFSQTIKTRICDSLGTTNPDLAGRFLAFCIGLHDIGKATPVFQLRDGPQTETLAHYVESRGFNSSRGKSVPHGDLSTTILADLLTQLDSGWPILSPDNARNIALSVGAHHGFFPLNWDEHSSPLGNENWAELRRSLLFDLAKSLDLKAPLDFDQPFPIWFLTFLAGLTSVSDWIGSNIRFFPLVGNPACLDDPDFFPTYVTGSMDRAKKAVLVLGWSPAAVPGPIPTFSEVFPWITSLRPLQKEVEQIAPRLTDPGIVILEAPMGEGKTEAALYLAETWFAHGFQGAYIALPTMATSNQMFGRVLKHLNRPGAGHWNLMLQHGKAALNESFQALHYNGQEYAEDAKPSGVVAERWFSSNSKQALLAPFGVGTIDQILLSVLQVKHYFVRLFGLAGKVVVVDEIHAYDAYTGTILEILLGWLRVLGCPVILLSATLPSQTRKRLLEAYGFPAFEGESVAYPKLTIATSQFQFVKPFPADLSRYRHLQIRWAKASSLTEILSKELHGGGCAAVIRNTVAEAQETYWTLRNTLVPLGFTVELFHARFPFGKRMEIENKVLMGYGKTDSLERPNRPKKSVLVATQVVEQSLDIDFDVMVSDVAPIDLVLQRSGRLWRHERIRPQTITGPQLYLIEPEIEEGLAKFGPSEYIYNRDILLLSWQKLLKKSKTGIQIPEEIEKLVEDVYSDNASFEDPLLNEDLQSSRKISCEKLRGQRQKAQIVSVAKPTLDDWTPENRLRLVEDDPETHRTLQAATRETRPSISLIVTWERGEKHYLDAEYSTELPDREKPSLKQIGAILQNEIVLYNYKVIQHFLPVQGPPLWKDVGLLSHHRLLVLDPSNRATNPPSNIGILLDPELGVVYLPKEPSQ